MDIAGETDISADTRRSVINWVIRAESALLGHFKDKGCDNCEMHFLTMLVHISDIGGYSTNACIHCGSYIGDKNPVTCETCGSSQTSCFCRDWSTPPTKNYSFYNPISGQQDEWDAECNLPRSVVWDMADKGDTGAREHLCDIQAVRPIPVERYEWDIRDFPRK